MALLRFIRFDAYGLGDMDPIMVVAGFVVLLALLLYYLYKEKAPVKEADIVVEQIVEPKPAAEKPVEAPEEPTEEPEAPLEKLEHEPGEPAPAEAQPMVATDDLESLSGVGEKYRTLLRAGGISSISVLADEDPDALLEKLKEANEREEIVKRLPRRGDVEAWVQKAKQQTV